MSESWENIVLKFKSANHIPVERATVTLDEFQAIEKERRDMLDALIAQYNHTKNDHHVNGMNEATKSAIESATGLPIDEMLRRVNINTVDGHVVVTRIEYDDIGPDINGFRRYRVYYIDARNKRAMKTFHDDQWRERALLVGMGGTND